MNSTSIKSNQTYTDESSFIDSLVDRFQRVLNAYNLRNFEDVLNHGGKFAEISLCYLYFLKNGIIRSLGSIQDTLKAIENLDPTYSVAIRIHVPRMMHIVYGFRSKSGGAHWKPFTYPNLVDAHVVWTMIEYSMIKLSDISDKIDLKKLRELGQSTFIENSSLVENIDGRLFINQPNLSAFESILLLLHFSPSDVLTKEEMLESLSNFTRNNVVTSLNRAKKARLVDWDGKRAILSSLGRKHTHKLVLTLQ